MIRPFSAAYYSARNRKQISALAAPDLDSAEQLWGGPDSSRAFRNVLVGAPERKGEIWQAWISSGEVEIAEDLFFYVLRQRIEIQGKRVDRWALYCELDIHDSQLFIHEDVLPEGVERARQATEACEADLAPVFVGCDESLSRELRMWLESAVQGQKALIRFEESEQSLHEVWPLKEGVPLRQILALFENASLFLLDGHHRLAAARENHRIGLGDGKILACVCSMGPSDTLILPIHRTVHYERWMLPDAFWADLVRAGCKVSEPPELVKVGDIGRYLETHRQPEPFCVAMHSYEDRPKLVQLPIPASLPPQLAALPVACLDHGVLQDHAQAACVPVPSPELALEHLALDQAQAAFFLPPVKPAEVRAIALSKLKMPRKSTRFVPKPALGLICRPWG